MSNPLTAFSALPPGTIGVDAGATLCKVARQAGGLQTRLVASSDLAGVRRAIEAWRPGCVVATGGGAEHLGTSVAGAPVQRVPEFEAWTRGAPILADLEGLDLPGRYLLVSLGTGTSILSVEDGKSDRAGGSALGGGTLLGLGRLLLGVESFAAIIELAARGDRRRVDLLVGDIYGASDTPLPRELNASSFAKLASREPADLAHALIGLVGENIALICGELARSRRAEAVIYCGSTLSRNPVLAEVLQGVTGGFSVRPHLLEHGAFCGAVGAACLASV